MKTHNTLMSLGFCLVPLASAIAQETQQEGAWTLDLGLESEYTDNANKSRRQKISERQDEANLRLGVAHENSWLTLEGDYNASERRFDKDTQSNRSRLEGESRLELGKAEDPAQLEIRNSRRTQLNNPDDDDLLRNTDEREIWTAEPTLRWRTNDANTLALSGSYSDIRFRDNAERDSDRKGGSLLWQRQISATDSLTLNGQFFDIGFDARPELDYELTRVNLSYQAQLRRLGYRLQLGYEESDRENGQSFSEPSYEVELSYDSGVHRLEFYADRFISDNSTGGGNRGDFDNFNPVDAAGGQLDQMERTNFELTWRTGILCERCDFSLRAFYQDDDFLERLDDLAEIGAEARFSYQLSRQSSLNLSARRRTQDFSPASGRADSDRDQFRITYRYQTNINLSLQVFALYEERDSDNPLDSHTETRAGLRLSYRFR